MDVIWKDIPGYEGLYRVNQWGEIYSLYTNKILKYSISRDGYKQYNLYKNKKNYIMTAHKAVALAFIPNPENLPLVNHKDEDKQNCYCENLEWCSHLYNNIYNDKHIKSAKKLSSTTYQYDKNGDLIAEYESMNAAARINNLSDGCICMCCNGKFYTYKNFVWSNEELSRDEVLDRFAKHNESSLFTDGCISSSRKLSDEEVVWIREHYIPRDKEFNMYKLSEKFGVSRKVIECIIHEQTYKNLLNPS